ncbi:hypothetical protein GCM10020001_042770 [Nonomuraea salmonea]
MREALADLPQGALVLVACSGGADSLALAAATAFVAPRAELRAGLVTVDHQLQEGSGERAVSVARIGSEMGLGPSEVLTVTVGTEGGPEAAAREARYAALSEAAERLRAAAVLLGHTRDDQAETVLLGLARGSGTRSLSGMASVAAIYRRPLLGIPRATTVAACGALGLRPWDDPHNEDPRFTRVRVRRRVLPVLEAELGPGVAEALARTAAMAREDADALDEWADSAYEKLRSKRYRRVGEAAGDGVGEAARRREAADGAEGGDRGGSAVRSPVGDPRAGGGPAAHALARAESRGSARGSVRRPAVWHPDIRHQSHPVRNHRWTLPTWAMTWKKVLIPEDELQAKIKELAARIDEDYAGKEVLLVGVLKGAVMVMADLARALHVPVQMDWMAVSSYGAGTKSSGVVRVLKDLDTDILNRHVLIVEDIIDSGLTLHWLLENLKSRNPASLEICAALRKPDAVKVPIDVKYVGFDIPSEFVIGYGLDYAERYRNLPFIGTLAPHVYR